MDIYKTAPRRTWLKKLCYQVFDKFVSLSYSNINSSLRESTEGVTECVYFLGSEVELGPPLFPWVARALLNGSSPAQSHAIRAVIIE